MTTDDPNDPNAALGAPAPTAYLAYTAFGVELYYDPNDLTDGTLNRPAEYADPSSPQVADVCGEMGRYRYAGAHGYQSDWLTLTGADPALPAITLQHLGYRRYQPAIGRFVQRDPIGLGGSLNCYAYVNATPVASVDPFGLKLEAQIVKVRSTIYVHFYDRTTDFWGCDHLKYDSTKIVNTHMDGWNNSTGTAVWADCAAVSKDRAEKYVTAFAEAVEKLDEETRKQMKRMLDRAGNGGKIFKPLAD